MDIGIFFPCEYIRWETHDNITIQSQGVEVLRDHDYFIENAVFFHFNEVAWINWSSNTALFLNHLSFNPSSTSFTTSILSNPTLCAPPLSLPRPLHKIESSLPDMPVLTQRIHLKIRSLLSNLTQIKQLTIPHKHFFKAEITYCIIFCQKQHFFLAKSW